MTLLFASLLLASVLAPSSSLVERTATGVRLVRDGRTVWNLEIDTDDGKPYVHPLTTPSGLVLTDVRPADHRWHKGLWFSWKFLNGANCWETPDKCGPGGPGRTVLKSKDVTIAGLGATIRLALSYGDREGEALTERRTIEFLPPDAAGGYAIRSDHEFTALRDVTLERTPPYKRRDGAMAGGYAGLTLRLAQSAAARFCRRSDGKDEVMFADAPGGERLVLRALDQPESAKFYAWPDRRMLNLSPVWSAPIELKAGERLHLGYEVRVEPAPRPAD